MHTVPPILLNRIRPTTDIRTRLPCQTTQRNSPARRAVHYFRSALFSRVRRHAVAGNKPITRST